MDQKTKEKLIHAALEGVKNAFTKRFQISNFFEINSSLLID